MLPGALGVDRSKEALTGVVESPRLVFTLTSVNQIMRLLNGDAESLPFWGHAPLAFLGDGEDMLLDSEALKNCLNWWRLPESWKGSTVPEKRASDWGAKREPSRQLSPTLCQLKGATKMLQEAQNQGLVAYDPPKASAFLLP